MLISPLDPLDPLNTTDPLSRQRRQYQPRAAPQILSANIRSMQRAAAFHYGDLPFLSD